MSYNQALRNVQCKILEIAKFIDRICRTHDIKYFIMGGTALGAVRHGGFIPWDDDLDIFMTPCEFAKFKNAVEKENSSNFVIQEWKTTNDYLEYAKLRLNGTTFIEENFKHLKDMHHGIYVDIMILHKVPINKFIQKLVYFESKFVTLYGLSQRNWKPKSKLQSVALKLLKILPCKYLAKRFYMRIYKYDNLQTDYKFCYWITPAKFKSGLFDSKFFMNPVDIPFEDTCLLGSEYIKEYLTYRYGEYMKLPSTEQQKASIHAVIYDTEKDFTEYFK